MSTMNTFTDEQNDYDYDSARKWYISQSLVTADVMNFGCINLLKSLFVIIMVIGAIGWLLGVRV